MSEANKNIVRRFFLEVVGQGRLNLFDELFAERIATRLSTSPLTREWLTKTNAAFRNRVVAIEGITADGDLVCCRWSARLTRTDVLGAKAFGPVIELDGASIFRIERGRIAETWDYAYDSDIEQKLEALVMNRLIAAVA